MKILVDIEGREAITKLIDLVLKAQGAGAYNFVTEIIKTMKIEENKETVETKTEKGK